jgi:hypothetical protein
MRNESRIRERYLVDGWPVRLGGLAANLARISSFSETPDDMEAVDSLIVESEHFIEWTALECPVETQPRLVELQVQLARWHRGLPAILTDPVRRESFRVDARNWSDRTLSWSGLLTRAAADS